MPTVLLVEDSATQAKVLATQLQRGGFEVLIAEDGQAGLEMLGRNAVDIVLTDLMMPRLNGLELVERIRDQFPHIPTVLMTSQGSEDIAFQALQQGAAGYVPKKNLDSAVIPTLNSVLAAAEAGKNHKRFSQCIQDIQIRLELENDCTLIPPLVDYLRQQTTAVLGCDETESIRVGIALEEALLDALYSGNLEVRSDLAVTDPDAYQALVNQRLETPPYRDRRIHVQGMLHPRQVMFQIRDSGPGFKQAVSVTDSSSMDDLTCRSRMLMRTFMDEVFYNDEGNELTLIKRPGSRR